jgi:hypothetical protein
MAFRLTGPGTTPAVVRLDNIQLVAPAPSLPGDYNNNGIVDATDYVVWRKVLGTTVAPFSGADGNGNGQVDHADYDVWRANFGKTIAQSASVSEDDAVQGNARFAPLVHGYSDAAHPNATAAAPSSGALNRTPASQAMLLAPDYGFAESGDSIDSAALHTRQAATHRAAAIQVAHSRLRDLAIVQVLSSRQTKTAISNHTESAHTNSVSENTSGLTHAVDAVFSAHDWADMNSDKPWR